MRNKSVYRLTNFLVPVVIPVVISFFLVLSSSVQDLPQFYDWFLQTTYELFCGPIHVLISAFARNRYEVNVVLSIFVRALTIIPFIALVPKQAEVGRWFLGINAAFTLAMAMFGFLYWVFA